MATATWEVPTLEFDAPNQRYLIETATGPKLAIPKWQYEEAVRVYTEQYQCSDQRAREIASKREMWVTSHKSGVFYRI